MNEAFTGEVAKAIQKHKKVLGVSNIRQNYKGTGSQVARRQLYVSFKTNQVIDIWLDENAVKFDGCCRQGLASLAVKYEDKTPTQIAAEVAQVLQTLYPVPVTK